MQKWEYLHIIRKAQTWETGKGNKWKRHREWVWSDNRDLNGPLQKRLKNLGQDGWELVSVTGLIDPFVEGGPDFDKTTHV